MPLNIIPDFSLGLYFAFNILPYEILLQDQGMDDTIDSDADPSTGETEAFWLGGGMV